MRKYPKKCPKCGAYMEPVFEKEISRAHMGLPIASSLLIEPESWYCPVCDK